MVKKIIKAQAVLEGAGVKLKRVFGFYEKALFDPFLLLDNFGSSNPDDYMKGFPWHPHRGMETVTYMLEGSVEHKDSLGNEGVINSGDIQWMTAGSGIIHQEMPVNYKGAMKGFQLWVNLPKNLKMVKPKYRELLAKNIPVLNITENIKVKIISGKMNNVKGAINDLGINISFIDISIENSESHIFEVNPSHTVFAYVYEGSGFFSDYKDLIPANHLVLFKTGDKIKIIAKESMKFLLIGGEPLNETIAWQGPIVMNTQEELQIAFDDYRNGTFIKE